MHRGTKIKITDNFPLETMQTGTHWGSIFKAVKEKKNQFRFLNPIKNIVQKQR